VDIALARPPYRPVFGTKPADAASVSVRRVRRLLAGVYNPTMPVAVQTHAMTRKILPIGIQTFRERRQVVGFAVETLS
jgi:hypothetical protein